MTLRNRLLPLLTALLGAVTFCRGAVGGDAILAAMKVREQENYSWSVIVSNDTDKSSSLITGKTERNGFSQITDTTPSEYLVIKHPGLIPRSLDIVTRSGRMLLRTTQGWRFPEELTVREIPQPTGRRGRGKNAQPTLPGLDGPLTYSIRPPHEDLAIIIGSTTQMQVGQDTFVGDLSASGAAQFISIFGQPQAQVLQATGAYQCWLRDGIVIRYEVHVSGRVLLGVSQQPYTVRWTVVAELSEFGTTRLTIPREVQIMLGA